MAAREQLAAVRAAGLREQLAAKRAAGAKQWTFREQLADARAGGWRPQFVLRAGPDPDGDHPGEVGILYLDADLRPLVWVTPEEARTWAQGDDGFQEVIDVTALLIEQGERLRVVAYETDAQAAVIYRDEDGSDWPDHTVAGGGA